ncbi:hypothetical protein [Mesorhizobium shangrilense]|uniref:Uncharacterized protein n=1 Tax=Mesorhizobium shangrilense TaxID=460060 RepID=A0ABV2D738_9HYPH
MDERLYAMWVQINRTCFDGQLEPLSAIGFEELSGPNGIGAHGKYVLQSKCIMIDKLFEFSEDDRLAGDDEALAKAEIACRLMVHEMIHQALYQHKKPNPGGHGNSFFDEAQRIANLTGDDAPTLETANRWPIHSHFMDAMGRIILNARSANESDDSSEKD